jgi:hypothetical protein
MKRPVLPSVAFGVRNKRTNGLLAVAIWFYMTSHFAPNLSPHYNVISCSLEIG